MNFDLMNKYLKLLAYLGIGFYAYRYFAKGFVASRILNIKVRNLNLRPISQASIAVELINPSNQILRWNSMSFDVAIDGFSIGSLNYLKSGMINANSSTTINLPIQINPVESLTFIAYLTRQNFKVKTISLKGNVNGEGFVVPINVTQTING
jgi:LEA14-like dessication related protein